MTPDGADEVLPKMDTNRVGVVGLGLLGTALAERLLKAGYEVWIHNRTREKAEPLLKLGARWADNPLKICDRVLISLYTTDTVEEVLDRLSEGLRQGQILIDTTTDAPLSGSSEQTRCAEAIGLDAQAALAALTRSMAYSRTMDTKGRKMIEGDFGVEARLSQHLKDVRLIRDAAAEAGQDLPLSEAHRRLLEAAGFGEADNSAVIRALTARKSSAAVSRGAVQ